MSKQPPTAKSRRPGETDATGGGWRAVPRPTMKFAATKTADQLAFAGAARCANGRPQTGVINQSRAHRWSAELQVAGVTLSAAELPNILAHLERDPGGELRGGLRQFWGSLVAYWPGRARRYSASPLKKRKAPAGSRRTLSAAADGSNSS